MPSTSTNLLKFLRMVVGACRDDPRDDAALLARFTECGNDEDAFQVLVWRHAPLVWHTCRRILGDGPDAEDAFQTTFLALACKASKLRGDTLAGWLHRVARQSALNAGACIRRRRGLEQRLQAVRQPAAQEEASRAELYAVLDEELEDLPERLRVPLVLRYLEGKTLAEVARILGCSLTPVTKRLARGEAILRQRLERRGLRVSLVSVGAFLGSMATSSEVPVSLIDRTARAALHSLSFRLGSSTSAALAGGVIKTMLVTKMKMAAVLLGAMLCLAGGGVLTYQTLAGNTAEPPQLAGELREDAEASRQPGAGKRAVGRVDCYGDPLPKGALARLGTVRLRHSGGVRSVALSPDGKTVASGGDDGMVRLWEMATGKEIRTLKGHKGDVYSVAFSFDDRTIASGGYDGTVRLWEAATGKENHILNENSGIVLSVAFSSDGKTLASGNGDGTVRLWESVTGKQIRTPLQGHKGAVFSVAFSPDGKTVGSGGEDGMVRLWKAATGKEVRRLQGHKGVVYSVAFSTDGKIVSSAAWDKTVRLWEVATGIDTTLKEYEDEEVRARSMAFSPDGRIMATGEHDGTVRLWDVATGKKIRDLKGPQGQIFSVVFSSNGKTVAAGAAHSVCLWEAATGREIHNPKGHQGGVWSAAFSSDGKTVVTGGMDGTVRLWEASTGRQMRILKRHTEREILSVALSPDSKTVASGGNAKIVCLWDVATGKEIRNLKHEGPVSCVAFSPDGKTVAAGGNDKIVRLWDVATGEEIRNLRHEEPVSCVAFSPNSKSVAAGGLDGIVRLWEVATGKEIRNLKHAHWVFGVAFSPDGKTVLTASHFGKRDIYGLYGIRVCLWRVATDGKKDHRFLEGQILQVISRGINSIAFTSNSGIVAIPDGEQVRLWDLQNGKELPPLVGHRGAVCKAAFSPDNRTLVSVSGDTTGLVWNLTYDATRPGTKLEPDALKALWDDLGSRNLARAWRAIWTLVATPAQSMPLLRDRLRPAPTPDPKRLARLIAELDAPDFKARQKAYQELEKLGPDVESTLRKGLEGSPSLEMRKRLQQLLESATYSGEVLRGLRAVQVLEEVGSPEARELLKTLAAGAPACRLTQEAQKALDCLNRVSRP